MSAYTQEPLATNSKQMTGHEFCTVWADKCLVCGGILGPHTQSGPRLHLHRDFSWWSNACDFLQLQNKKQQARKAHTGSPYTRRLNVLSLTLLLEANGPTECNRDLPLPLRLFGRLRVWNIDCLVIWWHQAFAYTGNATSADTGTRAQRVGRSIGTVALGEIGHTHEHLLCLMYSAIGRLARR